MTDLIVLAFDTENGASDTRAKLLDLQQQHLIELVDAAVVIRRLDGKVKVKQATSLVGAGALGGAFWGMLIGLLFWAPWLGLAVGAVSGAIGGAFVDIGVDDTFIKEVGSTIEPGHSALFLLVVRATEDKLMAELKNTRATVLRTSLSNADEAKLRAAFGADLPGEADFLAWNEAEAMAEVEFEDEIVAEAAAELPGEPDYPGWGDGDDDDSEDEDDTHQAGALDYQA